MLRAEVSRVMCMCSAGHLALGGTALTQVLPDDLFLPFLEYINTPPPYLNLDCPL